MDIEEDESPPPPRDLAPAEPRVQPWVPAATDELRTLEPLEITKLLRFRDGIYMPGLTRGLEGGRSVSLPAEFDSVDPRVVYETVTEVLEGTSIDIGSLPFNERYALYSARRYYQVIYSQGVALGRARGRLDGERTLRKANDIQEYMDAVRADPVYRTSGIEENVPLVLDSMLISAYHNQMIVYYVSYMVPASSEAASRILVVLLGVLERFLAS